MAYCQSENVYVVLSQDFLRALKNGQSTEEFVNEYAIINQDSLASSLNTDEKKLSFWINTYNAFIQEKLKSNPALYKNRASFFEKPFINIGGQLVSFSDIEHGIIRRSQLMYFLGYLSNPFPGKWEKMFRVEKIDYRVHFALNCGAKSCPPIFICDDIFLNGQLEKATKSYLQDVSVVTDKKIKTTSLFSWFRGDFGGLKNAKRILEEYNVISSEDLDKDFEFAYYWTLELNNFVEI